MPAERALHRHERPQAAVARLDLELHQPVRDGVQPERPLGVELHQEEAEVADLFRELARGELALLVPVLDLGEDPALHPLAGDAADLLLLVGEEVVDVDQIRGLQVGRAHEPNVPRGLRVLPAHLPSHHEPP